ncbi:unnamed protein product, partial [Symbiodinium sp. CCMP2456]
MVVYEKNGNQYLLMANSARGVMKVSTDDIEREEGLTEPVKGGGTAGQDYEAVEWEGVVQLDKLNDNQAVIITQAEGRYSEGIDPRQNYMAVNGRSLDMMSLAQPRLLLFTAIVLSFLAGEGFSQEAANNNAELSGKKLLKQVRDQLASLPLKTGQRPDFADQSNRQCIVFLSLARPTQGAIVGLGVGAKVDEAVTDASVHLRSQATMEDLSSGKLKLDVATFQSDLPTAEDLG